MFLIKTTTFHFILFQCKSFFVYLVSFYSVHKSIVRLGIVSLGTWVAVRVYECIEDEIEHREQKLFLHFR